VAWTVVLPARLPLGALEKPLNFWVWLEISRGHSGQDQGPVREITIIITSPERSNNQQCIVAVAAAAAAATTRERGIGIIAGSRTELFPANGAGDHDSSEGGFTCYH